MAIVAAMAIAGVSSALATSTQLCNEASGTLACPAGKGASEVHFISVNSEGISGKAKLLSENGTIECNVLISGTLLELASPQVSHVTLHYTNCNLGCSVNLASGLLKGLKTGSELASVTGEGFLVTLSCPFVFKCDYNAGGLTGHGLGPTVAGTGGKGHVTYTNSTVNLVEKLNGPFNCPTTSALHALFQSSTAQYIRE